MSLLTLQLDKTLEPALRSGHPWIYRNHLPKTHKLQGGDWVRVHAGKAQAIGLYDDEGQIAVRLFNHDEIPDHAFIEQRVKDALALRKSAFKKQDTNAYRLIFGEGDYLPGVTVDVYERYAVLQTYASSLSVIVPDVVKALSRHVNLRGIVSRRKEGLTALWGQLPPPELTVTENGLQLLANLYEGQKTGLFLDHRDNRLTLSHHTEGKTVLNLFSYTGAFSLYALSGGATELTSVDIAPAATEDARRNFTMNGFDDEAHRFITADVFKLLEGYVKEGRSFDVTILDPPSLARNKKSKYAAMRAYKKLNALALQTVAPGGLLATASCTSQVSPADFVTTLGEAAADAGVRLQIIHEAGQAADHPVPANFPEGRYLKFVLARVLR